MEVELFSLSGEKVSNLHVFPSDTVADLKEKLYSNTASAATFVVQILLDGACLEDGARMGDLKLGAKAELQVVCSRKEAREMLFDSPEVALQIAKQYDALQDQCREHLGSLFMDEDGKERSCRAKMEVVIALHQRLSKAAKDESELTALKAALAEFALERLRGQEEPVLPPYMRHVDTFVRCFPWLGPKAVQTLLNCDTADLSPHVSVESVENVLVSEYAKRRVQTLKEIMRQLPPPVAPRRDGIESPEAKLRRILEKAVQASKDKQKKERKPIGRMKRLRPYSESGAATASTLLDTPKQVLAAVGGGTLRAVGDGVVDVHFDDARYSRKATRKVVLEAIQQDPSSLLPKVDWTLTLAAVEEIPGIYRYLPAHLQGDLCILYAALECDSALQSEFMRTASKSEIHQWQWHVDQKPKKTKS